MQQARLIEKKILVVDDAEHFRTNITRTLDNAGYRVIQAGSGIEAVRVFQTDRPDVVIMDVAIDGLAALREIKALAPVSRVIMMSRLGQEDSILDAFEAGADDFLIKPLDVERMLLELENVLA